MVDDVYQPMIATNKQGIVLEENQLFWGEPIFVGMLAMDHDAWTLEQPNLRPPDVRAWDIRRLLIHWLHQPIASYILPSASGMCPELRAQSSWEINISSLDAAVPKL